MDYLRILWNYEEVGNVEHIDEHDLTPTDVEYVLRLAKEEKYSRSTGQPCVFGYTPDDEYIIVVYEWLDEDTICPITAYEVPEP